MPVNVNDIETNVWSPNLGSYGEVVTNTEDIRQSIFILISTVPGTLVMASEYGCGLFRWIDEPIDSASAKIARDIKLAIEKWEKRVTVKSVTYTIENEAARFTISVTPVSTINFGSGPDSQGTIFVSVEIKDGSLYLIDQFNRRISSNLGLLKI